MDSFKIVDITMASFYKSQLKTGAIPVGIGKHIYISDGLYVDETGEVSEECEICI